MQYVRFRGTSGKVRDLARTLAAMLAGRKPDTTGGLVEGFKLRVGNSVLMEVSAAFDVKAAGGTDFAGIKWPRQSREYIAYRRRFGPSEKAGLKRAAGLGSANRFGPGASKGLLSAAQLNKWRRDYAQGLAMLAGKIGLAQAKGIAAGRAWNLAKAAGARTMLEVYGDRQVPILKDTGVLAGSLAFAVGETKSNAPGQVFRTAEPGVIEVGTNVPYAAAHHKGNRVRRPLWGEPSAWPQTVWDRIAGAGVRGIERAVALFMQRGAA